MKDNEDLLEKITIKRVKKGILGENVDSDKKYDFLCCNPPFYTNKKQKEMIEKSNFQGENCEIYYKNGEVGFVKD